MMCTTFWHPDGTPMSAQQFLELLFGKLPEFFKNEAELRDIWSAPDTRMKLLAGPRRERLRPRAIGRDAEDHRCREKRPLRCAGLCRLRAAAAHPGSPGRQRRVYINTHFTAKQQVFLDFVLSHYVQVGVEELAQDKLTPLLRLKYNNAIADGIEELGQAEVVRGMFVGFQRYLYVEDNNQG